MGIKRFHLQLAAKRRWQSQLDDMAGHSNDSALQLSAQLRRWSAQPAHDRLIKDLP
jgi:hypothetical protein